MKMKPKFKLREGKEPKREERREAKMPASMLKRMEANEGEHMRKGGRIGKRGC